MPASIAREMAVFAVFKFRYMMMSNTAGNGIRDEGCKYITKG
jgi:hypothetical protein